LIDRLEIETHRIHLPRLRPNGAVFPGNVWKQGSFQMTVLSTTATPPPAPLKPPEATEAKKPEARTDGDIDITRPAPPPPPAALPPGQGTRVDQLA
jgi:hypothetical protein